MLETFARQRPHRRRPHRPTLVLPRKDAGATAIVTGPPATPVAEGEMDAVLWVLAILLLGVLVLAGASIRVVTQFERGVVLRFGRLRGDPRGPGMTMIAPVADRLHKVNMQVVTMPVPAQDGITRDNVTVKVDAVVYYKVY